MIDKRSKKEVQEKEVTLEDKEKKEVAQKEQELLKKTKVILD